VGVKTSLGIKGESKGQCDVDAGQTKLNRGHKLST
jgi:hypothetical protein